MESNEVLDRLPRHLMNLVIDQPYKAYTGQDHAVWRYVMRQNVHYLQAVAHGAYLEGLKKTGISLERIPEMYGMNRILKEIGWAAVAVDGFIPPAAFMEFQAYNVLVIAADIRSINQVLYTPAPDIIHEAAGHAPIIADEEYAVYLSEFGKIGSRAFASVYDKQVYDAVRHLSILKADPYSTIKTIQSAEEQLQKVLSLLDAPSEMTLLRNMHWWTVEYGLIGTLENPKIYGAGLLSSIGESHNCLKPGVKKLHYSLEAQNYSFDITRQQPQLFVTPDFKHLHTVLQQFAETLAMHKGGMESLLKARQSETTCTVVYNSGLQVSGKLVTIHQSENKPVYLGFEGPAMLSFADHQLEGHGTAYHREGFGSPVGRLKNDIGQLEYMREADCPAHGIVAGEWLELTYESGVKVSGRLEKMIWKSGCLVLLTFSGCTVNYRDLVLFRPEWGLYDMAVGSSIVSAFSGPADPDAFGLKYPAPREKTHHLKHTAEAARLHNLYNEVSECRATGNYDTSFEKRWQVLKNKYPQDWLLPLEMAEILSERDDKPVLFDEIIEFLKNKAGENDEMKSLVGNGLKLIGYR